MRVIDSIKTRSSSLFLTWLGSDPAIIWPVIMPGIHTTPITFIWLSSGVSASRTARATASRHASRRLAPSASSSSTLSPAVARSSSRAPSPTATPDTALPSMTPSVGTRNCAFHHGVGRTTVASAYSRKAAAAAPRQPVTCSVLPAYVWVGRDADSAAPTAIMRPA